MRKRPIANGNEDRRRGIGKVLTGLVFGSVVGATVGLLMAPASGEETRGRIKGEVKGVQNKAKDALENVEDRGREMISDARDNLENVRPTIAERVTKRKKSASG